MRVYPIRAKYAAVRQKDGKVPDIHLYGALFAGAVASFCLERVLGRQSGLTSDIVAIIGDATCGWSWLLVRALFRRPDARREIWPQLLVLMLVATGAGLRFDGIAPAPMRRMIGNMDGLISSTLLLLATIEPLRGIGGERETAERRFRMLFALGYAAVLATAVLWIDGSPAGSLAARWGDAIKAGCAILALLGMGAAILYRHRHPMADTRKAKPRIHTAEEEMLGQRLLGLMTEESAYTQPDLRVAQVARRIGEAEYKVTQCVTGVLGFRNFNHLANHFRVREAQRRLRDARLDHLPILTIALDCGFGSIGPFNRAFKAETGMTPTRFRATGNAGSARG